MFRKVTKTGPATLTIALPADWARENKISAGSYVEVQESDKQLMITTGIEKPREKIIIQYDASIIEELLEKVFLESESTIIIQGKDPLPAQLQESIKRFPGFQIVEESAREITIERALKPTLQNPKNILRRAYRIILQGLAVNPALFPKELHELLFILQIQKNRPKETSILKEFTSHIAAIKKPVYDDAYALLRVLFTALYQLKYSYSEEHTKKITAIVTQVESLYHTYLKNTMSAMEITRLYHCTQLLVQLYKEILRDQSITVFNETRNTPLQKKFTIGVCLKNVSNTFWAVEVKGGVEKAAGEYVQSAYQFNSPLVDYDVPAQERILEEFIARKVDGIIFAPGKPNIVEKTIAKINAKKIPLVIIDTDIELPEYEYTLITFDNYQGGYDTGTNLRQYVRKGATIIALKGYREGNSTKRITGFQAALGSDYHVVVLQAEFQESIAYDQITAYLRKHQKKVAAIFATSDNMAIGAIKACRDAGIKIPICGFDMTSEGRAAFERRELISEVSSQPQKLGELAVESMQRLLTKKAVAERIEYQVEFFAHKEKKGKRTFK